MKRKSLIRKKMIAGMGLVALPPTAFDDFNCINDTNKCVVNDFKNTAISGIVVDDLGQPLEGASVFLKSDTTKGTATASNGLYTLENIPKGSEVVFSFIGFQPKTFTVGSIPPKVMLLEQAQSLDEVILIADKKKNVQFAGLGLLGVLLLFAFIKKDKKKPPVKASI